MDETPGRDAVELRVHGISGVTAERILDHPIVVRVAGDTHAGFFRPRPGSGTAGGATDGVAVEAYRWGSLTAGAAVRTASMLLLLPFMLSNLAIWLRPPGHDRWGLLGVLCRLLGGTLTATFMLAAVGVTLDLVGWQCVPYPGCRASRPYLAWLHAVPAGPRLALLSVVPLLALRVVWAIGTRSARAFEGFGPSSVQRGLPGDRTERLTDAGFWQDEQTTGWLRQIHVVLGIGTLNVALLAGISPGGVGAPGHGALFGIAVGLLGVEVVLLALPAPPSPARARRFLRPLWAATVVVTVLCLGSAVLADATPSGSGKLPGYEGAAAGVVATQGVLLVVLTVVTYTRQRAARDDERPVLRGLGTPIMAAAAVSVGAAFTATLVYRVADILDHGDIPDPIRPNPPIVGPLDPPVAYWWAALAGLAALLIGAAVTSVTLLLSRRRRRRLAARIVERDYPDVPAQEAHRLRLVRETIVQSRITEELGPVLLAFLLIASLGLATVAFDVIGIGPTQLADRLGGDGGAAVVLAYVTDAGVWVISLLVICLLILGFRAYRSAQTRRVVAVLWDLGTFWPRTVHPFAPPCYAARAVPELAKRVTGLTARGPVVISGHSHGSVLAAATILQLPPAVLARVSLLTYGSPLRRTYARLYPAYLGPATLRDLGGRIGWRWRNLWRDTDPIGGPIFPPGSDDPPPGTDVDTRLRDPHSLTVDPADTVPPPIERHWPYHTQAAYQAAIRELIDRSG
ncbi:hypothetical protein ACQP0U_16565 [Micromonospora sp. CA-269861]|uniref:hypothetical protein n=1 Tax=Micromonospora sp. CA-269861 TaxID=3239968 RepID=UPI003D91206C